MTRQEAIDNAIRCAQAASSRQAYESRLADASMTMAWLAIADRLPGGLVSADDAR